MTSCAILFFFFFFSLLFRPFLCQPYVFPNWSFLIQTARQIQRVYRRDIRFPPPRSRASPPSHPFYSEPTCPTVFASRVTKDAEIQKSRSLLREIFHSYPSAFGDSMDLAALSPRSVSPTLHLFFVPVKVLLRCPLLCFLPVFSPFFRRNYPGFLTPFFPSAAT